MQRDVRSLLDYASLFPCLRFASCTQNTIQQKYSKGYYFFIFGFIGAQILASDTSHRSQ